MRDLGFSFGIIQKILKKNKYKPYKSKVVQKLSEEQIRYRHQFCIRMVGRLDANSNFLETILWTDFATFTTAGCVNRQNNRFWATQNPWRIEEIQKQGRTSVHVWCGIYCDRVLGPIFLHQNLTGQRYLNLLQHQINDLILQLENHERIIWQQDGAPPHNIRDVTQYLNEQYSEWYGKYGTVRWPANSPDLTPPDTFLWGFLKNKVYKDRPATILDLQNRIQNAVDYVNQHPDMITNCLINLERRYRMCVEKQGRHFEQFL